MQRAASRPRRNSRRHRHGTDCAAVPHPSTKLPPRKTARSDALSLTIEMSALEARSHTHSPKGGMGALSVVWRHTADAVRLLGHKFGFGNTLDQTLLKVLGCKERGHKSQGPLVHATGKGWVLICQQ